MCLQLIHKVDMQIISCNFPTARMVRLNKLDRAIISDLKRDNAESSAAIWQRTNMEDHPHRGLPPRRGGGLMHR